jgi:ribosome-binding factor A
MSMPNKRRQERINDEVRREISGILHSELQDPRVSPQVVTVTRVDVTQDLKYCKVYISVLGDEKQKTGAMQGITSAAGYIRKLLAERVNLRQTPELTFIYDDAIERGIRISKLIDEVVKNERTETAE